MMILKGFCEEYSRDSTRILLRIPWDSKGFREGSGRERYKESITVWGIRKGLKLGSSARNSIRFNNESDRVPKMI